MTNPHPTATDRNARNEKLEADEELVMRGWSKDLHVWGLCDNSACRRARACRGQARTCVWSKFSRLPDGVQLWFHAMLTGSAYKDYSYDEAMHFLRSIGAVEVHLEWKAAVNAGKDMRAPGAVHEINRRCATFAAWKKQDEVGDGLTLWRPGDTPEAGATA